MFNFIFKLSSNICNHNYYVDFNHAKHQILFTQNSRFTGSPEQLNKTYGCLFLFGLHTLSLRNTEFANSENVLYKRCFVMLEKVGKV